jgi:hypothetical protein
MISESVIFSFIVALIVTGILLYGSYWAFAIRKVRTSKLYRRQALTVGVVGVYYGILWVASPFTDQLAPRDTLWFAISALAFFVGAILIFSWIDGSIRVARNSDPIRRDTFHWSKTRLVIWALIIVDIFILGALYRMVELEGQNLAIIANIPFLALFLAIFLIASPALFVASRRSKDPTLHRNLRWFALFVVFVLFYTEFGYFSYVLSSSSGSAGAYSLISSLIELIITVLPIIGAFSLYRSARSLAPIRSLSAPSMEEQRI